MHKNPFIKHLLELNLGLILISTSGVLGRYIDLAPPVTIWMRAFLAAILLGVYSLITKINLRFNFRKDGLSFIAGSVLLGIHWITYFYALKLSNVAIGLLSLFTFPVITSILEPLFLKLKFDYSQLLFGLLVVIGVYFLLPNFDFKNDYTKGVLIGVVSAFFYSLRIIVLKKQLSNYQPTMLMFYQLTFIVLLFWPLLFMFDTTTIQTQLPGLITLALITTAIGHTMFVVSLKHFSATTAGIISSIQPIYGILLAYLFLNEIPSINVAIGGFLILTTVGLESLKTYKKDLR